MIRREDLESKKDNAIFDFVYSWEYKINVDKIC